MSTHLGLDVDRSSRKSEWLGEDVTVKAAGSQDGKFLNVFGNNNNDSLGE